MIFSCESGIDDFQALYILDWNPEVNLNLHHSETRRDQRKANYDLAETVMKPESIINHQNIKVTKKAEISREMGGNIAKRRNKKKYEKSKAVSLLLSL